MSRHKLGAGILTDSLAREIRRLRPSCVFVVIDPGAKKVTEKPIGLAINKLSPSRIPCLVLRGTQGERLKTPEQASKLTQRLIRRGLDRQSLIVAVGGGASTDLTGFAAASALRGVRWGVVSTTLLSMADAGLGGKTGVNLPEGKNLMGAFHMPEFVLSDLDALETLESDEWLSGSGEILKAAMLSGPAAISHLEQGKGPFEQCPQSAILKALQMSVRVKKKIVQADPLEAGPRKLLNLGHTFGHALEIPTAQLTYSKRLRHGVAVSLGLMCALRFATETGLCAPSYYERIRALAAHLGLPTTFSGKRPPSAELKRLLKRDKKAVAGKLELILPTQPGRAEIVPGIRVSQIEKVLRRELG